MMKNLFTAVAVILLAVPVVKAAERSTIQVESGVVPSAKPNYTRGAVTEVDGNDLAVDELLKIAFSEEESLRIAAVQVMGDTGTPRARAALGIVLYGNSMSTVRAEAADQLGNLGDGESVFALALALETERDSEVRDVISANVERNLPSENDAPGIAVARAN
jgi:HEAT repeat protein